MANTSVSTYIYMREIKARSRQKRFFNRARIREGKNRKNERKKIVPNFAVVVFSQKKKAWKRGNGHRRRRLRDDSSISIVASRENATRCDTFLNRRLPSQIFFFFFVVENDQKRITRVMGKERHQRTRGAFLSGRKRNSRK